MAGRTTDIFPSAHGMAHFVSQKKVSFPFFSVSVKAPDSRACVLNHALACEVIQQFDLNHYHALLHAPDEACGFRQLLDL
jgi:hypothetical protein